MTRRLWGRISSVNVQKVLWTLAELGIDCDREDAGFHYGQVDTDAFRALNPNGRIPVWREPGLTLWESHAIVRHLVSAHPGVIDHSAVADQWMEFGTSTLQPPFIAVFFQCVRLPMDQRSDAVLAKQSAALNAALAIVEGHLSGKDWMNNRAFSTAEIALGAPMHRIFDVEGWPRDTYPAIEAWLARLRDRPAYRDHVMTSYEELRA